jgi:4-alpha-glucanotransferase
MVGKEGRTKEYYCFVQYEFFRQWFQLKKYVNSLGIQIIGDIPIYVAMDSADILSNRKMFQFDADGRPTAVAGCPPDSFSAKGQLWGNPLYDWDYHEKTGYAWWVRRLRHCFRMYDIVRVDHFRGFDEYYSIPYGDADASGGSWKKGPGMKLFHVLRKELGNKPIIAEDLGYITASVQKLVKDTGYPGMKVLEFGFDSREEADYRPNTWIPNCAAYTGTHDNQTLASWFREISEDDRKMAADYLKRSVEDILKGDYVYDFIRMAMTSVANTAIIPMHDYCRLTKEARINTPSTLGTNWTWRFLPDLSADSVWEEIAAVTKESGRC